MKDLILIYSSPGSESPDRAGEITARFPDARFSAVEVRPILDMFGQEM